MNCILAAGVLMLNVGNFSFPINQIAALHGASATDSLRVTVEGGKEYWTGGTLTAARAALASCPAS